MDVKIKTCDDFKEHPGWTMNPSRTGVTWDAWCSLCGFKLENKPFGQELYIEGDGRRLSPVVGVMAINGEIFRSDKSKIACSVCCPNILKANE